MRNTLNCSLSVQNKHCLSGDFFFLSGSLRSNKNSHCDQLFGGRWSSWTWWWAFTGWPLGVCQWEVFGQCNFGRGSGSFEIRAARKSFSWNLQTFGGKDCNFFLSHSVTCRSGCCILGEKLICRWKAAYLLCVYLGYVLGSWQMGSSKA